MKTCENTDVRINKNEQGEEGVEGTCKGKVKSAYEPSGSSGRSLSRFP